MPSSTHSQNQWNCCHYLRRLFIHSLFYQSNTSVQVWLNRCQGNEWSQCVLLDISCRWTLLCSTWLDSCSILLWKGQTCLLHRTWMVEPQQLYSRGGLPFYVQPIFHATSGIVHNRRSSSWLLHFPILSSNHSFIIHSLLVLSHHMHILYGTIA